MISSLSVFLDIILELIIFMLFVCVCSSLTRSRFTAKKTALIILLFALLSTVLTAGTFLFSHDIGLTFGLMSLTAYLPSIITLHIISDGSFFATVFIWSFGLLASFGEKFLLKALIIIANNTSLPLYPEYAICLAALIILGFIIFIVTVKYIRKPFSMYIRFSDTKPYVPAIILLLIVTVFSYFFNMIYNHIISILLFFLAIAVLFVMSKLLLAEYTKNLLKREHTEYESRIKAQHEEFKELTRKHELFREYRHDMRHHLLALGNILQSSKNSENSHAEKYISSLLERLDDTENVIYCQNQMINAVLSVYISKAKKAGCVVDTNIDIQKSPDIDDLDLCIVLSNALENAVNACENEENNNRFIKIKISFNNVLCISIKNTCTKDISFDKNSLPVVPSDNEHGIGIKSIADTVKRYNGIFKCNCTNGKFNLNIIMFSASRDHQQAHAHKPASAIIFSLLCICIFLNASPTVTDAFADVPVLGGMVRIITAKQHQSSWGMNSFNAPEPSVSGSDEINSKISEYIEILREKYIWYAARKNMGYCALDSSYTIICSNEKILSICFNGTLNAGSSEDFSRCFTFDIGTGKVLELSDLFLENADYITPISNAVIEQMTMQSEYGYGNYYIPGGIWADDECFKSIEADQNFYINHRGKLVIVFNEYEVAPGSMGCVEFVIPTDSISSILSDTSLIY